MAGCLGASITRVATTPRVAMTLYLECRVSKTEPDFETPGLERGVSIAACAARGFTHLGVSGGTTCVTEMITQVPKVVRIPIEAHRVESSAQVEILKSTRLNISVDRLAASVTGVVTKSLAGQASLPLHEIFSGSSSLTPIEYGGWKDISAALSFTEPKIIATDGKRTSVRFVDPPASSATDEIVSRELKLVYDEAWTHAQTCMCFKKAPSLHKCMIADPVGIVGCGYNLAPSVVNKACALSNEALESALVAAVGSELNYDDNQLKRLHAASGLQAAEWAGTVMTSLSSVASWLIPLSTADPTVPTRAPGASGDVSAPLLVQV